MDDGKCGIVGKGSGRLGNRKMKTGRSPFGHLIPWTGLAPKGKEMGSDLLVRIGGKLKGKVEEKIEKRV